ncbi:MAG: hypothetical protein QOD39_2364 [Mycobacterium sp.]|jgi:hypothetical protein|nr:hypothetical protein [Mycobacterium sp.]
MTSSEPEHPAGGFEYPPLENAPSQPDPYAPVDYPTDSDLPAPIYPPPPPGYPAAPAYYPGYDPYWPPRPPGTNGKAVASLVTSVIGLSCCGVTSIFGVILGVIAMRETRSTGQEGHGLALAGTIIGGLAIAGWVVYILFYVVLVASGWSLV